MKEENIFRAYRMLQDRARYWEEEDQTYAGAYISSIEILRAAIHDDINTLDQYDYYKRDEI